MLQLKQVGLTLNERRLLDDISLDCAPGSVTALIGPNGAGKSTLLGVMAGDHAAQSGSVTLMGRGITLYKPRELAAVRAVMSQDNFVRFPYRVDEVVLMGRALRNLPPDEDLPALDQALNEMEIGGLRARDAMTLSGGEQARTSFARTRMQETPIVLLDEPTAALDLRHQESVMRKARSWAMEGRTVITVMHDLNLAAAHADQIVLLDKGQLIAAGSPDAVLQQRLIEQVYQQPVLIMTHPQRGCPVVVSAIGHIAADNASTGH